VSAGCPLGRPASARIVVKVTHGTLHIGDVEVSVICEGWAPLDLGDEMPGHDIDWATERERYPWAFHDDQSWSWHVHAFLLDGPAGVTLVDSGLGAFPPIGRWNENASLDRGLTAAGLDPVEVGTVVLTHLHPDHAGGTVVDGHPRFPSARHVVHPADWSYFETADRGSGSGVRAAMARLEDLGLLELRSDDHDVGGGLRVVHAPGHTPGHRVAILGSGREALALTGDLLHVPPQITIPDSRSSHDEDPVLGAVSRVAILGRARAEDWHVAVSHFGRPFGRIAADGWHSET
jgi:glyoxylase-like metal-dependent hydrolase (beta-lactamase superfamily II)